MLHRVTCSSRDEPEPGTSQSYYSAKIIRVPCISPSRRVRPTGWTFLGYLQVLHFTITPEHSKQLRSKVWANSIDPAIVLLLFGRLITDDHQLVTLRVKLLRAQ